MKAPAWICIKICRRALKDLMDMEGWAQVLKARRCSSTPVMQDLPFPRMGLLSGLTYSTNHRVLSMPMGWTIMTQGLRNNHNVPLPYHRREKHRPNSFMRMTYSYQRLRHRRRQRPLLRRLVHHRRGWQPLIRIHSLICIIARHHP